MSGSLGIGSIGAGDIEQASSAGLTLDDAQKEEAIQKAYAAFEGVTVDDLTGCKAKLAAQLKEMAKKTKPDSQAERLLNGMIALATGVTAVQLPLLFFGLAGISSVAVGGLSAALVSNTAFGVFAAAEGVNAIGHAIKGAMYAFSKDKTWRDVMNELFSSATSAFANVGASTVLAERLNHFKPGPWGTPVSCFTGAFGADAVKNVMNGLIEFAQGHKEKAADYFKAAGISGIINAGVGVQWGVGSKEGTFERAVGSTLAGYTTSQGIGSGIEGALETCATGVKKAWDGIKKYGLFGCGSSSQRSDEQLKTVTRYQSIA